MRDYDLELGQRAAEALRSDGMLGATAIFWWHIQGTDEWKFVVAASKFNESENSPKYVYLRIRKLLDENALLEKLPLSIVWAIETNHPIVDALRKTIRMSKPGMITLSGVRVGDTMIDQAFVYFLSPNLKGEHRDN